MDAPPSPITLVIENEYKNRIFVLRALSNSIPELLRAHPTIFTQSFSLESICSFNKSPSVVDADCCELA